MSAALVSAAMVLAGPALAGPGGGGGGGGGHGGGHGGGAGANAHGGLGGVFDRGGMSGHGGIGTGADINGNATRINSHANTNSSMDRTTVQANSKIQSSALPGLTTGMTVRTNAGVTLGTVSRVVTDRNGNVIQVFVTTSNGRTLRLSPTMLSMNGNILVTNTINTFATNPAAGVSQGPFHASPTGIARASPRSVLASGSVAASALPGLTTGLAVTNANNTNIGTISRIVTDTNGNVRLVIVTNTSTGQSFRLAPTTLSINGTTVMTTSTVGG